MADKGEPKRAFRKLDVSKMEISILDAESAPDLYTDSIEVSSSLFDFRLSVRLNLTKSDEEAVYRQLCTLRLAPPHFKALVDLMNDNLRNYESEFGSIPMKSIHEPDEDE